MQAFKIIVTDPDSVLNSLTREVKEAGPDGQEVALVQANWDVVLSNFDWTLILYCILGN